ncbi:MAG: AbrB/MazE/SpoVT family DNA-binding domain-containing protein [Deltaproteobacteria bacterium]|nr:AbrB/MazE/SpoVT family DNA-binding domain-containing protein [Deltaproteobacteria bacterium]
MALATLTTKGQVTIPKAVRDSLSLHPGDKVEFAVTQEGEAVLRPVTRKVEEVFGSLRTDVCGPVTIEEMDAGIRRVVRKRVNK